LKQLQLISNREPWAGAATADCKLAAICISFDIAKNGIASMRKALIVATALLVSTPPALAGFFSDPGAESAKDRVVCKHRRKSGNTRFSERTCRTAREWEQISEAAKSNAAELVNRPQIEIRKGD
jgi:hypothetical protein